MFYYIFVSILNILLSLKNNMSGIAGHCYTHLLPLNLRHDAINKLGYYPLISDLLLYYDDYIDDTTINIDVTNHHSSRILHIDEGNMGITKNELISLSKDNYRIGGNGFVYKLLTFFSSSNIDYESQNMYIAYNTVLSYSTYCVVSSVVLCVLKFLCEDLLSGAYMFRNTFKKPQFIFLFILTVFISLCCRIILSKRIEISDDEHGMCIIDNANKFSGYMNEFNLLMGIIGYGIHLHNVEGCLLLIGFISMLNIPIILSFINVDKKLCLYIINDYKKYSLMDKIMNLDNPYNFISLILYISLLVHIIYVNCDVIFIKFQKNPYICSVITMLIILFTLIYLS